MKKVHECKFLVCVLLVIVSILHSASLSASEDNQARIHHVVICWLKEPENESHRQELIEAAKKMETMAGVLSVEVGTMLPSERAIVDSSFDIGIIMSFKDESGLQAYLLDPAHQKATKEVLAPLTSRVVVYDFVKPE